MVYLIDDKYLFTGDALWFGVDGGYSFIDALAEDNELSLRSLAALEQRLRERGLRPIFITGHTGWTDDFDFAFAHRDSLCSPFKKKPHDPSAPYDAYDESDDTEENARGGYLKGVGRRRTVSCNLTAPAMCCIPSRAKRKYAQELPCTIPKVSAKRSGKRCSGNMRSSSPIGAPTSAAEKIFTTARGRHCPLRCCW